MRFAKADELWIVDYKTGSKKALRLPLKKSCSMVPRYN